MDFGEIDFSVSCVILYLTQGTDILCLCIQCNNTVFHPCQKLNMAGPEEDDAFADGVDDYDDDNDCKHTFLLD